MEKQWVAENRKERERLRALVNGLTDEELNLVIYKEGWTIAVVLAHLAFWDERRLVLHAKWSQKGVSPSAYDGDVLNDTTLPFLLAIPPREAANMAVSTAEALDRELEKISPDMQKAIEVLNDRHALNRAIHRKMHLDEIEAWLKAKHGKK